MDEKLRAALAKLLPRCTSDAGEDYPTGHRYCIWCGLIESSGSDFHRPDCPVVTLRRMLKAGDAPPERETW